jgi:hypothetical protein
MLDRWAETFRPDARNIRHACQPEKSAVAEHRFEMAHDQLSSTSILVKAIGYVNYLGKEAIKIRLHLRNFLIGIGEFQF